MCSSATAVTREHNALLKHLPDQQRTTLPIRISALISSFAKSPTSQKGLCYGMPGWNIYPSVASWLWSLLFLCRYETGESSLGSGACVNTGLCGPWLFMPVEWGRLAFLRPTQAFQLPSFSSGYLRLAPTSSMTQRSPMAWGQLICPLPPSRICTMSSTRQWRESTWTSHSFRRRHCFWQWGLERCNWTPGDWWKGLNGGALLSLSWDQGHQRLPQDLGSEVPTYLRHVSRSTSQNLNLQYAPCG